VVPCQKIILKNFKPEPSPSVDRPKIILFQHGTTSEMKQNYFKELYAVSVFYFNMEPRLK